MEMVIYKCPVCGFLYQVPEYWSGFSPEVELEMLHVNLHSEEMCPELMLRLLKKSNQ